MSVEESYKFSPSDFDQDGFNKANPEIIFLTIIRESEEDFHANHKPLYANVFVANDKTMRLLQSSFNGDANEILGMESVEGEVNIEMNLEIDEHSDNNTIYAIDSLAGDDEPLFLVIDDNCSDKEFKLRYDGDDDDLEDRTEPKPAVKDGVN